MSEKNIFERAKNVIIPFTTAFLVGCPSDMTQQKISGDTKQQTKEEMIMSREKMVMSEDPNKEDLLPDSIVMIAGHGRFEEKDKKEAGERSAISKIVDSFSDEDGYSNEVKADIKKNLYLHFVGEIGFESREQRTRFLFNPDYYDPAVGVVAYVDLEKSDDAYAGLKFNGEDVKNGISAGGKRFSEILEGIPFRITENRGEANTIFDGKKPTGKARDFASVEYQFGKFSSPVIGNARTVKKPAIIPLENMFGDYFNSPPTPSIISSGTTISLTPDAYHLYAQLLIAASVVKGLGNAAGMGEISDSKSFMSFFYPLKFVKSTDDVAKEKSSSAPFATVAGSVDDSYDGIFEIASDTYPLSDDPMVQLTRAVKRAYAITNKFKGGGAVD